MQLTPQGDDVKILYCRDCQDLFKLQYEARGCKCGVTKGKYGANGIQAIINGKGQLLGIGNQELASMLTSGRGRPEIFVIPHSNPRVTIDTSLFFNF